MMNLKLNVLAAATLDQVSLSSLLPFAMVEMSIYLFVLKQETISVRVYESVLY